MVHIIVGGDGNYHGKTLGAQMISGQHNDKNWIGYTDPNMKHIPFPYPWISEEFEGNDRELFHHHLDLLKADGVDLENRFGTKARQAVLFKKLLK